jgi:hypothetical protein
MSSNETIGTDLTEQIMLPNGRSIPAHRSTPGYLTLKDIAQRHQCSVDAARGFIRRHRVPMFRPSQRRLLVAVADLERAERALLTVDPAPLTITSGRRG